MRTPGDLLPVETLSHWPGQTSLPLLVRVADRLADMLIAGSELQADLAQADAGALAAVRSDVDEIVARIDALLQQLAA